MTYKERYLKEHPECDIDDVIREHCPGNVMDVVSTDCIFAKQSALQRDKIELGLEGYPCKFCWDLEIPGTEHITPMGVVSIIDEPPAEPKKILDSGERRQFESGAVRDIQEGKGRCDLMPLDVVGGILNNPTLIYINRFTNTGDFTWLKDAMTSSGIFHDMHTMFLELSKHFEEGAKKYGENNWQKGIPTHCYIDSAVRHYLKYLRGDKDEPHDRAFIWNLVCCIWTCVHKPELNDYKKKDGDTNE